jgi:hypothetical protein
VIKLKRFKKFLLKNLEDIFIFCGLFLINIPFYIWHWYIGIEVTGTILLLLGVYFARHPIKG